MMECKKCKEEIDSSDFWSLRWRLCDGCQAAEEDYHDGLKEDRRIEEMSGD